MTEEAVEASGGLEAVVAMRKPSPAIVGSSSPGRAASRREQARLAALGVGPGTGDQSLDGDGTPGVAEEGAPIPAMPDPASVPPEPAANPLNR